MAQFIELEPDPRIKGLIPEAIMSGDKMLVPHDLAYTKLLRALDYDVPAPVLSDYDWNGFDAFDVQKKTVAMMTTERRAYVLNAMGTGKSMCALFAFDYLKKLGLVKRMLVAAPLSTLSFVWQREVFSKMSHLSCAVMHGTKTKRLEALNSDADILVINHDGVGTVFDELMACKDIDMIVIDELSAYRSGSSARNKLMRKLCADKEFVYGLTGTPIPRDPTDVWGMAAIVTPHTIPKYFNAFRQELCYKHGPYKWVPKPQAVEKAFAALSPAVRYTLDDVVELPELVMQLHQVEMGPKQKKVYGSMQSKAVAAMDTGEVDALNAGAVLSKLLQISVGYVYDRAGATHVLDNDNRIQAILETIEESEAKVIVFVPFKNALAALSDEFTKHDIDHAVVSGDTPAGQRKAIFGDFQDTPKYKVLLAHPQVMAHGLTLTAATTICWAAPVHDLEVFTQANARISRVGQRSKQLVRMICGSPVEKKVYNALAKKEDVQSALLDMIRDSSD